MNYFYKQNQRMRPNPIHTQMDFRVIPSALPLRSPSPDKKNANYLTPTISPNAIEIKKNITPVKIRKQKELIEYRSTQTKYMTHSAETEYSTALKEKDQMIQNLRKIIDMLSDNNRRKKHNQNSSQLRDQIKILTIQNQKLVTIIQKISKQKSFQNESSLKYQSFQKQIQELTSTLHSKEQKYKEELNQLQKSYKTLSQHNKAIQSQKNELQLQNTKLLKILKDKNEANSKLSSSKLGLSDVSEQQSEGKSQKSYEKITLLKIKQQHSENLRGIRDQLTKQIQQTFDTMKMGLDSIDIKVSGMGKRLNSVEKSLWQRLKNTTQVSPFPTKHNKSQIYIEQGPQSSSSRDKRSKHELSQISQVQRQSKAQLQQQLASVKGQLEQLRFKYEKICMDTSSITYSKRAETNMDQLEQKYQQTLREVKNKQKQIDILYEQVKNIEQEKLQQSRRQNEQKNKIVQDQKNLLEQLKKQHQKQIENMHSQTQTKVKLLVENYQMQIQMLKRELVTKNVNLNEASQQSTIKQSQLRKAVNQLNARISELQMQNQKIRQNNTEVTLLANNEKLQWQRQKLHLKDQLQEAQNDHQKTQNRKKQLQQQIIMYLVEINQNKKNLQNSTQQAKALSESKHQLTQENQKLLKQIKNLRQINEQIETKQKQNQQKLNNLAKQIQQSWINTELQKLKELVEGKLIDIQSNQASFVISQHYEEVTQLKQQIQALKLQIVDKDKQNAELCGKIVHFQGLFKLYENKWKQCQGQYTKYTQKITELQQEIYASGRSKQESKRQILAQINRLQDMEKQKNRELITNIQKSDK